ncbi:type II secretion system secretin GspD [Stutzerimonas nitrititolerans]|uniref:type II secretion system secretin GspD n=1 Tax=Stutzerimonas nitrititolerans TaxID=2482751 RepID=UPI0035E3E626
MRHTDIEAGHLQQRLVAAVMTLLLSGCSSPGQERMEPVVSEVGQPLISNLGGAVERPRREEVSPATKARQERVAGSTSPGTTARGTTARTDGVPPLGDQPVRLNFVEADLQAVLRALSRSTGRQFLADPRVKGQLTLVSEGEVPAHQAFDMLLGALRMQGFTIVDVAGISHVVPEADAKLLGGPVYGADEAAANGMVTRTFRLQYENAVNLIPVLRPIVSPNNPINAYPGNNTVVVTDYADNLERIARIIADIDTPGAIDTDVVPIQNGIAADIAAVVSELLDAQGNDPTQKIVVLGEPRSNTIIVRASSPERTHIARDLIHKLDNAQGSTGNLHVVYLRNAQAVTLAQALRGLLTGESDSTYLEGDGARAMLSSNGMQGTSGATGTANQGSRSSGTSAQGSGAASPGGGGQSMGLSNTQGSAFSAAGVTVQADATTNTLLISAPDPLYRSLREVIDLLDQRRAQVVIESLIVEVSEDDASEFGIQWQAGNLGGNGWIGGANLGGSGLSAGDSSLDVLPPGLSVGVVDGTVSIPGIGEILDLKVLARALKSKGGTNVLSTPNILTLDNELASIFVGQTIPFVSGQYVTDGGGTSNNPFQTIQREEVGLKLNVRPQISEGGTVKLDIYQEVSSVDQRASNEAGTVTSKRAIDTSILLDDGQIMVLGGLLQDGFTQGTEAIPGLSRIPGLGVLFRYERRQRTKTNLMVFLRPYIIRDRDVGRGITLNRYDFIRRAQESLRPERNWALPDMSAPTLPPAALAIPGEPSAASVRAPIRAVPLQAGEQQP